MDQEYDLMIAGNPKNCEGDRFNEELRRTISEAVADALELLPENVSEFIIGASSAINTGATTPKPYRCR